MARLAVAATAPFGADVLEQLAARHDVVALLTRPDRPRGRGRRLGEEDEEELRAFANPRVVATGDERESADEGCLSLQGVLVPVERVTKLTLEAQDLSGEPVRVELEGLDARVVQHELDHLDGVLTLDRTTDEARREALAKLRPRPVLLGRS